MTRQAIQQEINTLQSATKKAAALGQPEQEKRCQAVLNELLSLKSQLLTK
ncbi:hypothetical protein [Endozoicomonas sp. GU-1]|nr:hypothetical protein [Endozoicomonas sp. GU-1]WBA79586.1 hypothetical protein O2T12_14475 [Endozoicomonas sp. GU-1]